VGINEGSVLLTVTVMKIADFEGDGLQISVLMLVALSVSLYCTSVC
jgi:high-affinity K+ transport system ATPase subunit B